MRKVFFIILALAICYELDGTCLAQVQQEWVVRYEMTNTYNKLNASIADAFGNVFVTGSYDLGNNNIDYLTIKYNTSGIQQWIAEYSGPANGYDIATAIAIDNSGNVYVTGASEQLTGSVSDIVTVKYNSSGVQQWTLRYQAPPNAQAVPTDIKIDVQGNIYVTGWVGSAPTGGAVTLKYTSGGVQVWNKIYSVSSADKAKAMNIANDGNIYILGTGGGLETVDMFIVKYNSAGDTLWSRRDLYMYAMGGGGLSANSIQTDASNNVYISCAADFYSYYTNHYFFVTAKYDASGGQQWIRYDTTSVISDYITSMAVLPNGNVFITGPDGNKSRTIKYNSSGIRQWVSAYNTVSNGYYKPVSIASDALGNSYITGSRYIYSDTSRSSLFTIKYDTAGNEKWEIAYNYLSNYTNAASSVLVCPDMSLYVTGTSIENGYISTAFVTIKYSQLIGIHPISSSWPKEFSLSQNYPNPFNPSTKIKFSIPPLKGVRRMSVTLKIYDVLGSLVASLIPPLWGEQEGLMPGTYEVEWDASNFPSGVYFYKLTSGNFNKTKRMVLIK